MGCSDPAGGDALTPLGRSASRLRVRTMPQAEFVEPSSSSTPPTPAKSKKGPSGPSLNFGGEGGIHSSGAAFAALTPLGRSASRLRVQTLPQAEFVEPESSSTPPTPAKSKKGPSGPSLNFGGEGGIRTLDTLPYTHFPGVRLRPLGHLSVAAESSTGLGAAG